MPGCEEGDSSKDHAGIKGQLLMLWPLCDPKHQAVTHQQWGEERRKHSAPGCCPPLAWEAAPLSRALGLVDVEALLEMTGYRFQGVLSLATTDN